MKRIKLWKQHFENLLGNPPKITHEPITRIISKQLDIKLGPFTQEELDSVLRKIKNRKAAGLDEILPEVWKTRQFDDILLRHCNAVYNQNPIDRWMKGCILPFPKKGDLGLAKNYRGITLTSIEAKIYNALLRNRVEPKIDNILRKNQNGFRRNRSTTSQILTIRRILEGVRAKNLQATLIFVDFTKAFDSIHRGKMEQILLAYGIPKETVAAITILYRNTKVKVRSPDGDTEYDQHEHTFSNYVRIRDIVQKTCLRRWTIGKSGERGSGISVLPARHDDDDDDFSMILVYFVIFLKIISHYYFY